MTNNRFADIILPFAVRGRFTYGIPDNLVGKLKPGVRVTVPFGSRNLYAGIVYEIHDRHPDGRNLKSIAGIQDLVPAINETQLKLWIWMAEYYLCCEGEVMKAALPSESSLSAYKPRLETLIILSRKFSDNELNAILDNLAKASRQQELVSAYLRLSGYSEGAELIPVGRQLLLTEAKSSPAIVEALIRKGILRAITSEVTRLGTSNNLPEPVHELSDSQKVAYNAIRSLFQTKDIVLLHGVTSSGKTEIYIKLIGEQLKMGRQVLYMLPEIALTTQIILRLKKHFGEVTGVYHSRFNDAEKVEIWKKVAADDPQSSYRLILGVR